jgi:ribosome-associated toxin RatA of RatAB toxin-antitoxin module
MKRTLFCFSVLLLAVPRLLAASSFPDEQAMQRLELGEILLYETRTDESGGAGRVQALVHAPAADVWAVIISCEQAFLFVDGLKSCEVLEDNGDRVRVHQVVKKHWLLPKQDFVFLSLRKPYREIDFELLEGNLDVLEGSWRFTPLPQGLLLEYEARIKPSLPAPRWLVRRTIVKDTPDLIACIRGLADGSGSPEAVRADLARCPGNQ